MQLPTKKRSKPYFWATSISNLLGEDKQCKYSTWLSGNYQFQKLSSDGDFSAHDEMVRTRARQHKNQNYVVYVEEENTFHLPGRMATIGGRPDLIVVEGDSVVIEDCKSGKQKKAHRFQVLIYMLLYRLSPIGKKLCGDRIPKGRLVYHDEIIEILPNEIDKEFKDMFSHLVAVLCASTKPSTIPSFYECSYCNIPDCYCPERKAIEEPEENHDLF